MASSLLDICRFNPTAGGTTDWTYSSAVQGYQSLSAAGAVNGATYSYRAESADLSQWEIGTGVYNSGTGVLTRGAVLFNSAGTTAKVNFSTVPQVAIVALAEDLQTKLPAGQLSGTATNDNANAGNVGELIESSVTSVSLTSGTQTNVTSISLTAGDWDVWANLGIGATSTSVIRGTITTTSATIGSGPNGGAFLLIAGDQSGGFAPIGQKRISLSATTTVYLVTQCTFTGTGTANGYLGARRRR